MLKDKKIQEIIDNGFASNQFDLTNYIYNRLREYGYEKMSSPLKIGLKITNKCNFRCIYCFTHKDEEFMSFETVKKVIDDLEQKPYEIYLTGGDPFLHPNIFEIIDFLYNSGIQVKIHSTGIIDNKLMASLNKVTHKISSIQISIDSIKDFEKIRKSNIILPLEKVKSFVHNFVDTNKILINTVVSNYNYNELFEIIDFIAEIGLTKIRFSPIFCSNKSLYKMDVDLIDLYYDLILYAKKKDIIIIADPFSHPWSLNQSNTLKIGSLFCPAQKTEIEIDPKGNVFPCPFLHDDIHKMGNLFDDDINEIWKNGVSALEKRKWSNDAKCKKCKEYDKCGGGCYASAYTNSLEYDGRCLKHE